NQMAEKKLAPGKLDAPRAKWAKRKPETPDEIVECLNIFTSLKEVSRRTPQTYHQCHKLAREAVRLGLMEPLKVGGPYREDHKKPGVQKQRAGRLREKRSMAIPLPAPGKINKFIFTCATNDTQLKKPVFENLKALVDHFSRDKRVESASLHVARITYMH